MRRGLQWGLASIVAVFAVAIAVAIVVEEKGSYSWV